MPIQQSMDVQVIDFRCDANPKKLFARLRSEGEKPPVVEGNLIEMVCRDCRDKLRVKRPEVTRVVHRFNLIGILVETVEYEGSVPIPTED